jgi:hypothetical protein
VPWEFISLEPNDLPLVLDDRCRYFHRHVAGTPVVHDLPEPGPSQASALILRMGEELEASYERGHTRITGLDLRRQYEGFGFGVLELSQPNAQTLEDYARDGPRIVHIVANIGEDFDRLFLDFGGEQFAKRRLARLTAKEVGFALREAGAAPLVILDIPAPPSITERLRQLCLRNAFAAELAASEAPPAILCTGLGEGMRQVKLTDALLQGLADARPIGEIARFIWSLAREIPPPDFWEEDSNGRIDEILPLLGTALFAQDPEQRFLLREE